MGCVLLFGCLRLRVSMARSGKAIFGVIQKSHKLAYIREYIDRIDKLTIMTVDPGFAGQPFIKEMLGKIREARCV